MDVHTVNIKPGNIVLRKCRSEEIKNMEKSLKYEKCFYLMKKKHSETCSAFQKRRDGGGDVLKSLEM